MLAELPSLPSPVLDVAQDDEGYSAELSVERDLLVAEFDAMSAACLRLQPVIRRDGEHEIRGLVSVDDDALWVYVHQIGPGRFGSEENRAARELLEHLWRAVHVAAAGS